MSIRGGAEHGLGVYISGVDVGSPAAAGGLRVSQAHPLYFHFLFQIGDQIMEVNGIGFTNILHTDAARTLK